MGEGTSGRPFDGGRPGAILRTNAAFRRLWTARSISAFGDSLGLVALIVFLSANDVGAAFAVAGLLLVGEFFPSLLGPFAGGLSDRFDRRRVMVISELVQAMAMLLIAITLPPMPVLLLLIAVQAIAGQVLQPAARSVIPVLVVDRHLESGELRCRIRGERHGGNRTVRRRRPARRHRHPGRAADRRGDLSDLGRIPRPACAAAPRPRPERSAAEVRGGRRSLDSGSDRRPAHPGRRSRIRRGRRLQRRRRRRAAVSGRDSFHADPSSVADPLRRGRCRTARRVPDSRSTTGHATP